MINLRLSIHSMINLHLSIYTMINLHISIYTMINLHLSVYLHLSIFFSSNFFFLYMLAHNVEYGVLKQILRKPAFYFPPLRTKIVLILQNFGWYKLRSKSININFDCYWSILSINFLNCQLLRSY